MRWLLACLCAVLTVALAAQDGTPAFEVVSVKRNVTGAQASSSIVQPGGRYSATNMTLRMLLKTAYSVHDDQITGLDGQRPLRHRRQSGDRSTDECVQR